MQSSRRWYVVSFELPIHKLILGSIERFQKVNHILESVALVDLVQITEDGLSNLTDLR